MFMANQLMGFGIDEPLATVSFAASAVDSVSRSTYTFTAHSIGTASTDRIVVVGIAAYFNAASFSISSVTIGGITATALYDPGTITAGDGAALYGARVPTGTTGDVVVTYSASVTRCGIGTWALVGINSLIPHSTYNHKSSSANPLSVSVTCPAGGVIIGCASQINTGAAGTYTWAGITESYDQTIGGGVTHSGAALAFSAAQSGLTVSSTYSQTPNDGEVLAVVAMR